MVSFEDHGFFPFLSWFCSVFFILNFNQRNLRMWIGKEFVHDENTYYSIFLLLLLLLKINQSIRLLRCISILIRFDKDISMIPYMLILLIFIYLVWFGDNHDIYIYIYIYIYITLQMNRNKTHCNKLNTTPEDDQRNGRKRFG